MDYPKFIVSNQKEESISIQSVNSALVRVFYDVLVAFLYFDICHYQKWQISKYGKAT